MLLRQLGRAAAMNNNSFGKKLGRVWSQYSYIFVLLIIMIGYAFTIHSNGCYRLFTKTIVNYSKN